MVFFILNGRVKNTVGNIGILYIESVKNSSLIFEIWLHIATQM